MNKIDGDLKKTVHGIEKDAPWHRKRYAKLSKKMLHSANMEHISGGEWSMFSDEMKHDLTYHGASFQSLWHILFQRHKVLNFICLYSKYVLALLLIILFPTKTIAYDVEVDGIYYDINTGAKTAEVTYSVSYVGAISIPSSFIFDGVEYKVTSIGNKTFYGCSGLTSVDIPNSVTSIKSKAFMGCKGLTYLIIPNSVTSIGSYAFSGCSGLISISISNSINAISECVFGHCSSLASVDLPNSVASIGSNAFIECSSLTSVTIPNSVKTIGDDAFAYCI